MNTATPPEDWNNKRSYYALWQREFLVFLSVLKPRYVVKVAAIVWLVFRIWLDIINMIVFDIAQWCPLIGSSIDWCRLTPKIFRKFNFLFLSFEWVLYYSVVVCLYQPFISTIDYIFSLFGNTMLVFSMAIGYEVEMFIDLKLACAALYQMCWKNGTSWFLLCTHHYGDRTRVFLDRTLVRSPVYQCFTPGMLNNQMYHLHRPVFLSSHPI